MPSRNVPVVRRDSRSAVRLRTFLSLGRRNDTDRLWQEAGYIGKLIQFEHAAPSGYRRGSRALGLGIDSMVLAAKALGSRGPFLVSNPWIGIALKLTGRKDVAVIGLYAGAGSRNFRLMRMILKDSPIVTMVDIEAEAWNAAGGRAAPILYGNTFHYPHRVDDTSHKLRLFVGGNSDRDAAILARLEAEIRASSDAVSLVVVTGDTPSEWSSDRSSIVHTGYVSAQKFGEYIADSDVVFLPLLRSGRAVGHMVTVGALEAGVPVASSPCEGMTGYINGDTISELDIEQPLIPQLRNLKESFADRSAYVRKFWLDNFSRRAFVDRIGDALVQLDQRQGGSLEETRS
jgi:glycosyltransferase involved in cell wall biosynthesis